jgi:hypothetical protein
MWPGKASQFFIARGDITMHADGELFLDKKDGFAVTYVTIIVQTFLLEEKCLLINYTTIMEHNH